MCIRYATEHVWKKLHYCHKTQESEPDEFVYLANSYTSNQTFPAQLNIFKGMS